jgi:hypothetical protein
MTLFPSFQVIVSGCCTITALVSVLARLPLRLLAGVGEVPIAVRRAKSDTGERGYWTYPKRAPALPSLCSSTIHAMTSRKFHSERLASRLEELSVPHILVQLSWATHGFDHDLRGRVGG